MSRRRAFAALACAAGAAALVAGVATSEPTRSQTFFRDHLVEDRRTAAQIRSALRDGSAFVERAIVFADLTGDDKDDAVVRVQSGGAAGAVAVYVFSTDGAQRLRVVHRAQRLTRATARVRDGVLTYRSARYEAGDEPCCPARLVEVSLRWTGKRFAVDERRELDGPEAPAG